MQGYKDTTKPEVMHYTRKTAASIVKVCHLQLHLQDIKQHKSA